jgi:hypothetical protein
MKLWLDDIRVPGLDWEWVKTPWEALELIVKMGNEISEWSLDHDLGEDIPTGYDFLRVIENMVALDFPIHIPETINIHSANPVGRKNMMEAISSISRRK